MDNLEVLGFPLGAWQTNCYILATGSTCWLVDVGFEPETMLDAVSERGLTPERIVLTHAHVDHIAGLEQARERFPGVPVAIHESETEFLQRPELNLSAMLAEPITCTEPEETLTHGQTLTLGEWPFEVRHVPGHSPGGVCLYQPKSNLAIVGDTLFAGSIGRHDFPTSDGPLLLQSIREQLLTLPDETSILPGHGPASTIGTERQTNPFVGTNP
ncbi:MBL fold metallo-hydrolase [Mucisphaera calidilacus]|uniref:Putative metallo-hydrolase n=1 Tax=Mucisphaera calidilacus TaxID=2527982 RepID=A0A518BWN8_9BACT|nr:MBL fold metallo-hydrolase [Mucisphaera calidilacus]QDU71344.1 putative metallo-hydrolase [Mucisphaera calidilacus]